MTSSIDIGLLAFLGVPANYLKYRKKVTEHILDSTTYDIIKDMDVWYKDHPNETFTFSGFMTWLRLVRHAADKPVKHGIREAVLNNAATTIIDPQIMDRFVTLDMLDNIVSEVDKIKDGKGGSVDDMRTAITKYDDFINGEAENPLDYQIDADVIYRSVLLGDGIEWRVPDLNKSVGQVHKSDFVLITKCPETGGTSFVISEFTHMLHQLPAGKKAILFHNEEGRDKVAGRILQCALNVTTADIAKDPVAIQKKWESWKGDRDIRLYGDTHISIHDIERVLQSEEYWLIGINVLDKISGYYKVEEVERLSKLGTWCRGIADKHGCVMAVVQAPMTAQGQKWLKQTDVYGNRTKLSGESDVMLGIGKTDDSSEANQRFINVIRNKKPLTGSMEGDKKYLKITAEFDHETGRYTQP